MNPKAIAAPGGSLLAPDDHTLIMIDFQPQMALAATSIDGICLRNNVALVASTAKAFAVSAIVTTMAAESFGGSVLDELHTTLPRHRVIDRTSMNCWEDAGVVAEINRLGKRRIVVCGLWTSVCVAGPVLSALDQDFDAYVIADACGDISREAHDRALDRMVQIGARPVTSLQYLLELQRDWGRTDTAGRTTSIVLAHGGAHGLGVAYAAKMTGRS